MSDQQPAESAENNAEQIGGDRPDSLFEKSVDC